MYIKLYETVIITKGITRALICDTHSRNTNFIPNDLADVIGLVKASSIAAFLLKYDSDEQEIIKEYLEFIVQHDFGFYCEGLDEFNMFPKKSKVFEVPYEITNCIVDVCGDSDFDLPQLFTQINTLHIPFLQIRVATDHTNLQTETVLHLLNQFNDTSINEIFLLLPYSEITEERITSVLFTEKYLTVVFYQAPGNKEELRVFNNVHISYSTKIITIPASCGMIKVENFNINEDFYREGLQFNNCLNRKICVDQKGEIKNCPSLNKSFGNIKVISLAEALGTDGFKDLWRITKDQVSICKDCEFRNICTDCRAYRQDPADKYSKPLKCGYDPNTNEWEDWSLNPLSKNGIEHYGLKDVTTKNK